MTIKPCPFCGSTNVRLDENPIPIIQMSYFSVGCVDCGAAAGVGESEDDAYEVWNTRKEVA